MQGREHHLKRMKELMESIPAPAFVMSAEGVFLGGNSRFTELAETNGDSSDKPVYDVLPPCMAGVFKEKLSSGSLEELFGGRYVFHNCDGRYYELLNSTHDAGYIVYIHDVTRRILAQKQLEEMNEELDRLVDEKVGEAERSLEELSAVYEGISDGLALVDRAGRLIRTNYNFKVLFAIDEDPGTIEVEDLFHHEEWGKLERFFQNPASRSFALSDVKCLGSNGKIFYADLNIKEVDCRENTYRLFVVRDVSERRSLMHQLEILARFPEGNPNPIMRINTAGKLNYSNHSGKDLLNKIGHPEDKPLTIFDNRLLEASLRDGKSRKDEIEAGDKVYSCNIVPMNDLGELYIYMEDITDNRLYQSYLRLAADVFENSSEAIMITDKKGDIVDVNRAFTEITGYARSEIIGRNPRVMKSGKHDQEFYRRMWDAVLKEGHWRGEIWDRRKDGKLYPKWTSISVVRDKYGEPTNFIGVFSDITKMKESEQYLQYLEHYDTLTDLPNRTLLNERLTLAIEEAEAESLCIAVAYLDLDGFKYINDNFGHSQGDAVIKEAAGRMLGMMKKSDTVARVGGDEFAFIMKRVKDPTDAATRMKGVLASFDKSFVVDDNEVFLTATCGITMYPDDGKTADKLFVNADTAMTFAKDSNRAGLGFFSADMNQKAVERLKLETALRRAVEKCDEFVLHYQPRVDSATGRIKSVEALIRWISPTLGFVSPGEFIPLAEDNGMIIPIGRWVVRQCARDLYEWCAMGLEDMRVSLNLSAKQFNHENLGKLISDECLRNEVSMKMIEVEITESTVMQNPESAAKTLLKLKEMGIKVAVDDFGTGYSSLSYLKRFPIDTLKVDRSFVMDIPNDNDDIAITRAIISLALSLNLKVTAEGVETAEQAQFLRGEGCHEFQGYYFSKPMPRPAIDDLLLKGSITP
ncbi:sensor domain-containing protein [Limisalsivibrio acetivorans]|uniref:sensor domain-containing protein n=1 Tax=Limisalsivibrio acetivorans TaxID=1304888 RepID=UPI000411E9D8|nr:EAL domain-containing protein [Limisalsivibrio acetivorans]